MRDVLMRIFPWSLLSVGIVLLIADKLIVPFILIAFISSIPFWTKPSFSRKDISLYSMVALFIVYVFWLIFSDNLVYGRRDVESKLSFLIFPMIFLLSFNNWRSEFTQKVKDGIILGVLVSMTISFSRACWCTLNGGEICFRNDQFGFNMHATYLSLMYVFAALLVYERTMPFKYNRLVKILFTLFILLAIYYMRSLSTLIAIGVLLSVAALWWIISRRRWVLLAALPVLMIVGYFAIQRVPAVMSDLTKTTDTVQEYFRDPEKFVQTHKRWNESNTVRIIVWKFSSELISSVPTGVGTGDVKDELFRVYRSHGYDLFAEKELNSHDQFLQTGVALGYIGIVLLFLVFVFAWKKIRTNDDLVLNAFLILTFITCLFESYLERQVGIIFFSFLLSTLLTDWKFRNREV